MGVTNFYPGTTPIILKGQSQLSWDNPTTNLEHDEDLVKNEVFFLFYGVHPGVIPEKKTLLYHS